MPIPRMQIHSKGNELKYQKRLVKSFKAVIEPPSRYQLRLPLGIQTKSTQIETGNIEKRLSQLLDTDLTFKGEKTTYATHSVHAFAAKFPPQIPRIFINQLTLPGERVLDPMMGSGTTLVEAFLSGRRGIGIDLDPLALLITKVKTTPLDLPQCIATGMSVLRQARKKIRFLNVNHLHRTYSDSAIEFFQYWFEDHVITELYSLIEQIKAVKDTDIRTFLYVVFSSIIITKSGGVTCARDLAHSRPHRDLKKKVGRNALDIFEERMNSVVPLLEEIVEGTGSTSVERADARCLPLADETVHLIVTSPPYAANAIDYVRAHKFSLIWFGYEPKDLSNLRGQYIGAELKADAPHLPSKEGQAILQVLKQKDERRAGAVAHYFCDMEASLREMLRVMVKGRAVILIVGSSVIRGVDIKAPTVLAELASAVGFRVVKVAKRQIVRDARMMPVSHNSQRNGIEARMHEEGIIGLIRPE